MACKLNIEQLTDRLASKGLDASAIEEVARFMNSPEVDDVLSAYDVHNLEDGIEPTIYNSEIRDTVWVLDKNNRKHYIVEPALNFVPIDQRENLTVWAANQILGDVARITDESLTQMNEGQLVDKIMSTLMGDTAMDALMESSDPENAMRLLDEEQIKHLVKKAKVWLADNKIYMEDQEEHISDAISGADITESHTIDPTSRASERVKLELARMPKISSNSKLQEVNEFFPLAHNYMPAKNAHNVLLKELSDVNEYTKIVNDKEVVVTQIDAMIEKIKGLVRVEPSFQYLVDKLQPKNDKGEIIKNPSVDVKALRTDFAQAFALSNNKYISVFYSKEGGEATVKVDSSGRNSSIEKQITDEWFTTLTDIAYTEQANGYAPKLGVIRGLIAKFDTAARSAANGELSNSELKDYMDSMGVRLEDDAFDAMISKFENKSDILALFDGANTQMVIQEASPNKPILVDKGTPVNLFNKFNDSFDQIAEISANSRLDLSNNSVSGAGGKSYFKFSPQSMISRVISALKDGDFKQAAVISKDPINAGSHWYTFIFEGDPSTNGKPGYATPIERANKINTFLVNLIKNEDTKAEADNKGFILEDHILSQIAMASQGLKNGTAAFLMPTAADKSKVLGFMGLPLIPGGSSTAMLNFEGGEFKVNSDYLDELSEPMVAQFTKYYLAEKNRTIASRESYYNHLSNIHGYVTSEMKSEFGVDELDMTDPEMVTYYDETFKQFIVEEDYKVVNFYHYNGSFLGKENKFHEYYGTFEADDSAPVMEAMTGNAMKMNLFEDVGSNNADINAEIKSILSSRLAETYNSLYKLGIIKASMKNGELVLESDKIDTKNLDKTGIDNIAYVVNNWAMNGMVSNMEFSKMFNGDIAMYKNPTDYFKRVPATLTDGTYMTLDGVNERYFNASIIKDVEVASEYITKIADAFGKDSEIVTKGYNDKGMNRGDGQGFITPNRWKFIMQRINKWDNKTAELYDAMVNDPYSLTKQDMKAASNLMKPLKGVFFNMEMDEMATPTYIKYSQAIIIPAFAKGTDLGVLLGKMDERYNPETGAYNTDEKFKETRDNVGELLFESAVKVGAANITSITDGNRLVADFELPVLELENASWKLQQDLPDKGMHDTLIASQVQGNVMSNLNLTGATVYKFDGEKVDGNTIKDNINSSFAELSTRGTERFLEKTGMSNNDKDAFSKYIIKELDGKITEEELEMIEEGYSLDAMPSVREKVQQSLLSGLTKAATQIKSNGGSFVQVSNVFSDLTSEEERGIIMITDAKITDLKPPLVKGGEVTKGQAFIGYSEISKYIKDDGRGFEAYAKKVKKAIADGKIDPAIFNAAIGYRIPNQNMSSNDALEIVGILPPSMSDSIVLYNEIVPKTGSDFDIDKMYIMMKSVIKGDTKGSYKVAEYDESVSINNQSDEAILNRIIDLYTSVLTSKEAYKDLMSPLDGTWMKSEITSITDNQSEGWAYSSKDKDPNSNLTFLDPIYQSQLKMNYMSGKHGVALSANEVLDHVYSQLAGVTLKNPISVDMGLDNLTRVDEVQNPDWMETKRFDNKGQELPMDKTKISVIISTFLNAYVDIAKDDYISKGNFTQSTFGTAALMLRAGMQKEMVVAFLSNPVIKEWDKNVGNKGGTFMSHSMTESDFADKLGVHKFSEQDFIEDLQKNLVWDQGDGGQYINLETMREYAIGTKDIFDRENSDDMQALYHTWKYVSGIAMHVGVTQRATKPNGTGITISEALIKENLNKQRQDDNFRLIGTDARFTSDAGKTSAGAMYDNSIGVMPIFSNVLISFMPEVKDFINKASVDYKGYDLTDKEFGTIIERAFHSRMYATGDFGYSVPNYFETLFSKEDDGLAKRVDRAKALYSNNLFLKALSTNKFDKGMSFVEIKGVNKPTAADKSLLIESFEEIRELDETLYKDLISYNSYATGLNLSVGSFNEFIPTSVAYENEFSKKIEQVRLNINGHTSDAALKDVMLNNQDLIPAMPRTRFSVDKQKSFNTMTNLAPELLKSAKSKNKDSITVQDQALAKVLEYWENSLHITTKTDSNPLIMSPKFNLKQLRNGQYSPLIKVWDKGKRKHYIYEHLGNKTSVVKGKMSSDPVYALIEGKGHRASTGHKVYEYGIETQIESNQFKNNTGDTNPAFTTNMNNFKSDIRATLALTGQTIQAEQDNNATTSDINREKASNFVTEWLAYNARTDLKIKYPKKEFARQMALVGYEVLINNCK